MSGAAAAGRIEVLNLQDDVIGSIQRLHRHDDLIIFVSPAPTFHSVAALRPMELMQRLLPIFDQLERDGYYSINGMGRKRRLVANASRLTAIFADIDSCHETNASAEYIARRVAEDSRQLEQLFAVGRLPVPSGIAFSGREIWLFYALAGEDGQAIPATQESIAQWRAVEDALIDQLKAAGLPVDQAVRDLARITRIPGSINLNVNRRVEQVWTLKNRAVLTYGLRQIGEWFGITTEEQIFYTTAIALEPRQKRRSDRVPNTNKRRGYEALLPARRHW
jgi:hypothetical protein